MLDTIVRYLHGARVPFRLTSYPSEEPFPKAAHPMPPHSMLVDSEIVSAAGRIVLACYPAGETVDYAALGAALGGVAIPGTPSDLPGELATVPPPIPPLGQLFGLTLVVDERLTSCSVLVFQAFGGSDFFDVPYDDWARLEAPRLASFASMGELEEATPTSRSPEPPTH